MKTTVVCTPLTIAPSCAPTHPVANTGLDGPQIKGHVAKGRLPRARSRAHAFLTVGRCKSLGWGRAARALLRREADQSPIRGSASSYAMTDRVQLVPIWHRQRRPVPPSACSSWSGITTTVGMWSMSRAVRRLPKRLHLGAAPGRLTSSYSETWVLSNQASSVSPQTVQSAWPVCGTRYFSSVRLYSALQLGHRTIVSISGNMRSGPYLFQRQERRRQIYGSFGAHPKSR
jgi:hypothetical protein